MDNKQASITHQHHAIEKCTPVPVARVENHSVMEIDNKLNRPQCQDNLKLPSSEQYNFEQSINGEISEDLALTMALALSSTEIKLEPEDLSAINIGKLQPEDLCTIYIDKLQQGDILSAEELYHAVSDQTKYLIDAFLATVPWRVSTEYRYDGVTVHWTNSHIKIGWFAPYTCETSPQLYKGSWIHDNSKPGIHFGEFKCVVWEGQGSNMIHRLLSNGSRVNVKLIFNSDYKLYIITDVAFTGFDEDTEILDLASVDIGSLTPLPTQALFDDLRILQTTITNSDGTTYKLFGGTVLGMRLVVDAEMYEIEDEFLITNEEVYVNDYNEQHLAGLKEVTEESFQEVTEVEHQE